MFSLRISACLLLLFVASRGDCQVAETIEWKPMVTAVQSARKAKKLVLVVQGPGKILEHPENRPAAQTYFNSVFADSVDKDFYEFRIAATYQPAGINGDIKRRQPKHANVVSYLCYPAEDGKLETLLFFVGFPTPKQLRAKCEWASELRDRIVRLPIEERKKTVRAAHETKLLLDEELPIEQQLTRTGLSKLLARSASNRDVRLRERFGKGWTAEEQKKLIGTLRTHVDLEDTTGHYILAAYPLAPLAELSKPVYEIMTRQMWARNPSLVGWFEKQRGRARPLVLYATEKAVPVTPPVTRSFTKRSLRPKNSEMAELLDKFDWIDLPFDQLQEAFADFDLTPPPEKRFNAVRLIAIPVKPGTAVYVRKGTGYPTLRRKLTEILNE